MDSILEVKDLRKAYGPVVAVDGVSLSIREGTCFGLLGPNGAGKTTLVEMMETILDPDGGQMLYRNEPLGPHFKERIGIQFQSTALQDFITVRETLELFSALYPKNRPIEEIIEICALADIIDRDNRKLSGGQRQRMLLGIALVNDPEIVFLDEPTTGLDPQARRNFWNLIENIKAENKTVVLTTHYMEEAEVLCEEIAIMDHGKVIAQDSPGNLLSAHFEGVLIRIPVNGSMVGVPEGAAVKDGFLEIQTTDVETEMRRLLEQQVSLTGLAIHSATLDDLFLKLTGSSLRE